VHGVVAPTHRRATAAPRVRHRLDIVLSAIGIDKSYTRVHANVNVSLDIREGEIHAVLGENGAGKSTLMRILYAWRFPTAARSSCMAVRLVLSSPRDAIRAGIGMVHQHFMPCRP